MNMFVYYIYRRREFLQCSIQKARHVQPARLYRLLRATAGAVIEMLLLLALGRGVAVGQKQATGLKVSDLPRPLCHGLAAARESCARSCLCGSMAPLETTMNQVKRQQ
jgi:hypothetical protein